MNELTLTKHFKYRVSINSWFSEQNLADVFRGKIPGLLIKQTLPMCYRMAQSHTIEMSLKGMNLFLPGKTKTLMTLKGGKRMSIVVQFQLPVSYEQFQELNKVINPENLRPPGMLVHILARTESGLSATDVWEDEAVARQFYEGATKLVGIEFPPLTISEVMELLP
jgi:hypothetical protein